MAKKGIVEGMTMTRTQALLIAYAKPDRMIMYCGGCTQELWSVCDRDRTVWDLGISESRERVAELAESQGWRVSFDKGALCRECAHARPAWDLMGKA